MVNLEKTAMAAQANDEPAAERADTQLLGIVSLSLCFIAKEASANKWNLKQPWVTSRNFDGIIRPSRSSQ
jgi:hypothetical protein